MDILTREEYPDRFEGLPSSWSFYKFQIPLRDYEHLLESRYTTKNRIGITDEVYDWLMMDPTGAPVVTHKRIFFTSKEGAINFKMRWG